jgi:hypothetical protein
VTLHPATWLLVWTGWAVFLQAADPSLLPWICLPVLGLAAWRAGNRTMRLFRRTRWLLLSILLLFVLATPGERLPEPLGDLGISYDGLAAAGEHLSRLVLLLASLAVLHEHLGSLRLLAGLHALLAPLAEWRRLRERIVVRLLLVLEYAESPAAGGWRAWLADDAPGPASLSLDAEPLGMADAAVWTLLAAGAYGWLG